MGVGGAAANLTCTIPAMPPSKGACVTGLPDAGVDAEADGGLDDAGNATASNCDPVTNAGCTGTDVCGVDTSGMFYDCFPLQGTATAVCGDCTQTECGPGTICIAFNQEQTIAWCAEMCCANSDCGSGTCDTMALNPALPSGVGICD
jgi:hypothetical protein